MKSSNGFRRTATALALAGLLSLPAAAMAFGGPAPGNGHQPCPHHHGWGMRHGGGWHRPDMARITRHVDARLARMKENLHLQQDQMAAWQQFETTVKDQTQAMVKRFARFRQGRPGAGKGELGARRQVTAPQRLDHRIERLQARLHSLKALDTATKALYAKLSPTQQTIFDLEARHRHHRPPFFHARG